MKGFRSNHTFLFLVPLLATAILGVASAQNQIGSYSSENLGKIIQPVPQALSPDSRYESAAYPAFQVNLAAGEGRSETQIYCGTCHTPRYILMQPPLPAATWDAEVHKMIKTLGAPIPDGDAQKIIQYLQTHYTPDTRK
jgi:hypothetical protein